MAKGEVNPLTPIVKKTLCMNTAKPMLELFEFNSNRVRVFILDSELWIVALDVAKILDYADPSKMLNLVDEEDKRIENPHKLENAKMAESFSSNVFKVSLINESGVYACIFGSTKPEAKIFKKWVTSELLPTIRKTGSYSTNQQKQLPSRDAIDYVEATVKLSQLEDSILTRLLKDALVDELELKQNQKLLPQQSKTRITIVKVRAKDLGYSAKQIGDGTALGRFVANKVNCQFKESVGRYSVKHYEINDDLDSAIHAYFLTRNL
jgi:prophage antirepressor-like protein